ncbi:LuxR C-terminal-related transcriptional regulator [Erythrobacter litoralis]|uniref:Two-component regulator n=1 Tax=Erythrobacter litoralis (strain HTCC2594) TaxID=314225 RepID=Q2N8P6_ERYLH|nr:response regulator transcription factor [Erythrobacter litoralis]ABC63945.1 two-component regulator [Erythrobacter litoralis HTCC2594]
MIVGDVMLYREGLARGLDRLGHVEVVDSLTSPAATEALADTPPDILVLDISSPDTLDIIRPLICAQPGLPVVGFGVGGQADAMRCAEAGISSFVSREDSIEDLDQAVLMAARGEAVCSPRMTARLIRHLAALTGKAHQRTDNCLTAREREVASLVKEGLSNKQIAIELGISPATVKNHVHMILEKLNMPRRSSIGMVV